MASISTALLLTSLGAISTILGGLIAVALPDVHLNFSLLNGFSSGVMIFLSFVELLPEAIEEIGENHALAGFFVGAIFFAGVTVILGHVLGHNSDTELVEIMKLKPDLDAASSDRRARLLRSAIVLSVGISLHNAPEGVSVFISTVHSGVSVGLPLALAIFMHNLPEGISVALPVFAATGSRWRAIAACAISGLFEPLGALVAALLFDVTQIDHESLALALAAVAGIMVLLVVNETLPLSYELGGSMAVTAAFFGGCFFCWLSLAFISMFEV